MYLTTNLRGFLLFCSLRTGLEFLSVPVIAASSFSPYNCCVVLTRHQAEPEESEIYPS